MACQAGTCAHSAVRQFDCGTELPGLDDSSTAVSAVLPQSGRRQVTCWGYAGVELGQASAAG
jgi:hypothetical protein